MKDYLLAMGIFWSLFAGSSKPKLSEGAIYSMPAEKGGYAIIKILKLDDHGVHVRLYSNNFSERPRRVDESSLYLAGIDRKLGETLGMGHAPISRKSFETWKAEFVQESNVSDEELEGYNMWKEAEGGYF